MRYTFIDVARGIAILLVVLGHCFSSAGCEMNKMILSFHMPLFFFLSGVFAKPLAINQLLGGAIHKAKVLLIPHLVLSLSLILLNGCLWTLDGNSLKSFNIVPSLFYWFLPVLFCCSLLFMLLSSVVKVRNIKTQILVIIVTAVCIGISIKDPFHVSMTKCLYWIRIIPTAFFFYYCGFCLRDRTLVENRSHSETQGMLILLLLAALYVLSQVNAPVKMYENHYGNYFIFLLTSFMGIYTVLEGARLIKNSILLREMGRCSIAIYVWNFLIIGILYRLTNRIMLMMNWPDKGICTGITFGISIICLFAVAKFTYKRTPIIYGVPKKQITK